MSGFNPLCGANKLKRSGGAGYTEKQTFTNDGKIEGKESFVFEDCTYVRIGDVIDIGTITAVYLNGTGIPIAECELQDFGGGSFSVSYSGVVGVYVIADGISFGVSSGTYVLSVDGFVITRIGTETVHPIDPKYLAKEINLDSYGIDLASILNSGQRTAVVEGTKKMWEEIDSGSNVVFTCNFGGGNFTLYPAMNAKMDGARIISMKLQSVDSGNIVDVAIVLHTTCVDGELVDATNVSCVMTTL